MTQTLDHNKLRAAQMAALDERFVEIKPTMTIYGPEYENLEFDGCSCSQCDEPVGCYIASGDGDDYCCWGDVFMDAEWNLWCEDCSWEVAGVEVLRRGFALPPRGFRVPDRFAPTFTVATDRAEDEACQAGTPGCCVDHKGGERCETW
jgi:hypothetical protein